MVISVNKVQVQASKRSLAQSAISALSGTWNTETYSTGVHTDSMTVYRQFDDPVEMSDGLIQG